MKASGHKEEEQGRPGEEETEGEEGVDGHVRS